LAVAFGGSEREIDDGSERELDDGMNLKLMMVLNVKLMVLNWNEERGKGKRNLPFATFAWCSASLCFSMASW